MGEWIECKEISIKKRDKGPKYCPDYPWRVEIKYRSGNSCYMNTKSLTEALYQVELNLREYEPTAEEVTCNGRFGCE